MPSVNRPTDIAQRDQSVSEKLQLYGIYSAFAQGKIPSNEQIDIALNSALNSKALSTPSNRLSEEGRKLVGDLHKVIENAKLLLLSKNDGQLIQDFAWQAQEGGRTYAASRKDAASATDKPAGPINREAARKDGQDAVEGLKTLGKLIITNGQFRKLLNDTLILMRSVVGDAATNVAGRVNPSEDELNQIDSYAEEGTWHDAPDFGEGDFKTRMKNQYQKSEFAKKRAANSQVDPTATDASVDAAAAAKDKKNEFRARGQEYLREKLPQERRDQTINRLRKMVVEIQEHGDYQNAIMTLLNLADSYLGHSKHYSKQGSEQVGSVYRTGPVQRAEADLKLLLERFANSTSMDDIIDSIKQVYERAREDPDLRNWFIGLNKYIRRCLQEPGFIVRDDAKEEWNLIQKKGDNLARNRYRSEFDQVNYELQAFINQFDNDPLNKALSESIQKLCLDLGQDENGKPKFKPHLVKDLSEVILPSFLENLSYVPLPRIEYSDKMVDLVVENLIVESDNLTPNLMELKSDNHWRWGRRKLGLGNTNKNKMMLAVSGIQMDLRDVSYHVNKKSGFPSIQDTGVMDIFLGGEGLSFMAEIETADRLFSRATGLKSAASRASPLTDNAHFFKANNVRVDLKNLKIKLKQSSHKVLFALVKPILLHVLRPVINKVIAAQIKKSVAELDKIAFDVQQEVERAELADRRLPLSERIKQPTYSRYVEAIRKRYQADQEKKKLEADQARRAGKTSDGQFKLVFTKEDSMFPNITFPHGVTEKATEFQTLANQGTSWESPVFAIGKAKASTAIPKVAKPTRKSNWANVRAERERKAAAEASRRGTRPTSIGDSQLPYDVYVDERSIPAPTDNYGAPQTQQPLHHQQPQQQQAAYRPSNIDTQPGSNRYSSQSSGMIDTPVHSKHPQQHQRGAASQADSAIDHKLGSATLGSENMYPNPGAVHGMVGAEQAYEFAQDAIPQGNFTRDVAGALNGGSRAH